MVQADWNIKFVTDWDEIYSESFQDRWLQWIENAVNSHVFFHPALCMAWIETYRPLRNLEPLLCIAENKSATVFLPLVLWKQNWKNAFRKIIIPVGYSDFDYHDPLANRSLIQGEWTSFYETLLNKLKHVADFDAIDLNGLTTEVCTAGWRQEKDIAPFTDLAGFRNSEEFLQSLKTSLRGDIRRQIRRISELGSLTLYEYTTVGEALEVLPHFLELHSARWPGAYKAPRFQENLVHHTSGAGILHFTSLKAGDKILSYHLGFEYKQRYYYYMPVIEPLYENLSPGKIHLYKLAEYAFNNGFTIFDHLRGDENYKAGWATDVKKLYGLSLENEPLVSRVKNKLYGLKTRLA